MIKQDFIYHVAFADAPFVGNPQQDFFFSSLSAIYDHFSDSQIGCPLATLYQLGVSSGTPYVGPQCTIRLAPCYRKRQKNPFRLRGAENKS